MRPAMNREKSLAAIYRESCKRPRSALDEILLALHELERDVPLTPKTASFWCPSDSRYSLN
jgi:hypothetical protein